MVDEFRICEEFRIVAIDEYGKLSDTIGYSEFMGAVSLIGETVASLRNCLIALSMPKHAAVVAIIVAERFAISPTDIILHSTALTFDPSIVELFLALLSGSALLITPDLIRSRPAVLADVLLKFEASIVQLTPSLLKLLPHSALVKMFHANSALRILMVGGESFPANFLRKYVSERTHVSVYNVYGVTEVSCWASCRLWNMCEEEVDIGDPLLNTIFHIDAQGELLIGGPRKCFLNGRLSGEWTRTGDLVERSVDGRIFWRGRCDDQLKLNGIRVSIADVANAAESIDGVDSAIAICWRNKAIVLFVKSHLNDIKSILINHLPSMWIPHAIVPIEEWPLNQHGKADRTELLKIFEKRNCSSTREDVSTILANYGIDTMRDKTVTFHSLGITSLCATELMFKLEHLVETPNFALLQFLLSETATVGDLLKLLRVDEEFASSTAGQHHAEEVTVQVQPLTGLYESSLAWEWDSGKCIDSTPIVHEGCVFVGSHSGRFVSINIANGYINWEIRLSDRIEAMAALQYGVIAVGCYDHCVYFIDEQSGTILWVFKTGDVVKSTPTFVSKGKCVVGSHDRFLYFVDYEKQTKLWQVECGGGVLVCAIVVRDTVIVASLSGKLLCASLETGQPFWEAQLGSPVFATPCIVGNGILLAVDVRGDVSLRECLTGSKIDGYAIGENVFAKPLMLCDSSGVLLTQRGSVILFGIHPFCILTRLKIGSSAFVRSPVLCNESTTVFLQNTTGQLFALQLSNLKSICQTKNVASSQLDAIQFRNSRRNDETLAMLDSEQQSRSSVTCERQAKSTITMPDISSNNGRIIFGDSLREAENMVESVAEVLSQNTETFGGVVIVESQNDDKTHSTNYHALIGSRDDRLRCFMFAKKTTS
ncbi:Acyl-CoA synthetase family member 4 -like protein [Toxocara canis]|uniref:Acyl-CoA synthetase family member 4-like protein n=1 Tax=Toxocara canis TaxID=6265 RepID=A0A0B2V877_TOXCA|nr:Acyl-CoA synthetase family member 4 -like protein [Toxocara canis]